MGKIGVHSLMRPAALEGAERAQRMALSAARLGCLS